MRSSYNENDVILLLKDVTGKINPLDTLEREKKIQQGIHYSEMVPLEYKPTKEYIDIFNESLNKNKKLTANAVCVVAEKIFAVKGKGVVLVSLARAGTPIGILIKRYLEKKYKINIRHYSISIIRGKGIDENAIHYILNRHNAEDIQFVDGWIGKGAIISELRNEVKNFDGLNSDLAVLSDPTGLTKTYGTREDFLIPSSCLNATVSGLFSRTILNNEIIGKDDFHGAIYYQSYETEDYSNYFLNTIEKEFEYNTSYNLIPENKIEDFKSDIENLKNEFKIDDVNFIKPGIGETTRVLLRRVPWKVLIKNNMDYREIEHILKLCSEKNVEVVEYPLKNYKTCGIIKNLNADI